MENKVIEELIEMGEELLKENDIETLNSAFYPRLSSVKRYRNKDNMKQLYKSYMTVGKLFVHRKCTHDIGEKIIYLSRVNLNKLELLGDTNGKENGTRESE